MTGQEPTAPLPSLPTGKPISYGPDRPFQNTVPKTADPAPQRQEDPQAPLRSANPVVQPSPPAVPKKVRLDPTTESHTREISSGVTFTSEYDKDLENGWRPVLQKGYIIAMTKTYPDGSTDVKEPGKGNPNPRRSRSLSVKRHDVEKKPDIQSASAPLNYDRHHNVFQYPEDCVPVPIRTALSNKPPPDPIKDVEIRPGEFVFLQRSLGRALIWEPLVSGDYRDWTPFLDFSGNRILPCDSCRKNLAPVCSVCNICTCFSCSKLIQSPMGHDPLRLKLPYLIACPCKHRYKLRENRDRSPTTSELTDTAWDQSGGHHAHRIHPVTGQLSSPCGRTAPSNKHPDRIPRDVADRAWEDWPIQKLCTEPPQPQGRWNRRRSRSPPRRRDEPHPAYHGNKYHNAPWRNQAYLQPAAGAVV